MSETSQIVIPIATAIGGLVVGSFFTRVTSRNDTRRDRYAKALSAADGLRVATEAGDATGRDEALREIDQNKTWLELDSPPVGNAYAALVQTARAAQPDHKTFLRARARHVDTARTYSRWALGRRYRLQIRSQLDSRTSHD